MIPTIDPSTPFADVLKEHGAAFLPLLPPHLKSQAQSLADAGLTLGQVQGLATRTVSNAARQAFVDAAPPELRAFVAGFLGIKVGS